MKRNVFISTGNVKEFIHVAESLHSVEAGVPGMGLVHGVKGLGKTTVAIHYAGQKENRAVYARAKSDWTYTWMMDELLIELRVTPRGGGKAKHDALVEALLEKPRLIIIDETNIIKTALLETLRTVHDLTHNPFLFIGHEGVRDRLMRLGPFYDRLLYSTELKPLSLVDLTVYCQEALDVGIDDDVLEKVLTRAGGNFRKSVTHLKNLEDHAKVRGSGKIDLKIFKEAA
ncbi:hypothetical protein C4J81_15495 [Deltaproteobacteria bacterium Smac51]|nr:hypothetical protein C4J81_15495 [Deltaproteobacteria bacterium Smac51]